MKRGMIRSISFFHIFILLLVPLSISFVISQSNLVIAETSVVTIPNVAPPRIITSSQGGFVQLDKLQVGQQTFSGVYKVEGTQLVPEQAGLSRIDVPGLDKEIASGSFRQGISPVSPNTVPNLREAAWGIDGAPRSFAEVNNLQDLQKIPQFKDATAFDKTNGVVTMKDGNTVSINSATGTLISGGTPYSYKIPLIGTQISNFFVGNLVQGVIWAAAAAGVIQLVGNLAGLDKKTTNAATIAVAGGVIGGKAI